MKTSTASYLVGSAMICLAGVLPSVGSITASSDVAAADAEVDLPDVPAPSLVSSPSEAEFEDLGFAAEEFGLTMEEAIRQFGWRDNFSRMAHEIALVHPSDFARAEIVDGDSAWIAFAAEQPLETTKLLGEFQSAFPHVTVDVRPRVGFSEAELNEAVVATHQTVMKMPGVLDAVTEYWSADNALQVTASVAASSDAAREATEQALRSALGVPQVQRISDSVGLDLRVLTGATLSSDDSWTYHYGGEALSQCTSGFGTRSSSQTSGTRGISTAGHCDNSLSDDGRTLTYQSGTDAWTGDFQWHTGPGTESDDFYSGSSSTLETNRRDVSAVTLAFTGDWLCTNGKVTKLECDRVRNTGVCSAENCNLIGMTNREQAPGDSGAPVFNGNTAFGIHEGSYTSGGQLRDVKSQALYMPDVTGAHVATS